MYSISKNIYNIKLDNSENVKSINHKVFKPEHEYLLANKNVYTENGELIKTALNPKDYDFVFYLRLTQIDPLYNISHFLNFHFSKTPDKNKFLLHIKYVILEYFNKPSAESRKEFIETWISEKETTLSKKNKKVDEVKASLNIGIFNEVKDKFYIDGSINDFYYKPLLESNIVHDFSTLDHLERTKQKFKNRIYKLSINICYLYKIFVKNNYTLGVNNFNMKERDLVIDLNEFTLNLTSIKDFELKTFINAELRTMVQYLKARVGIDITLSPFSEYFNEMEKECKVYDIDFSTNSEPKEWLEQSNEQRMKEDLYHYVKKFPNTNMEKFYKVEIENLKIQIEKNQNRIKPHKNDIFYLTEYKSLLEYYESLLTKLDNKTDLNESTELNDKKPKKNSININLETFLINKTDLNKLQLLQNKFKDYKGKKLTTIIYLLVNEFKIINISSSSSTNNLTAFLRAFNNANNEAVRKYFVANSDFKELKFTDDDYLERHRNSIKEVLNNSKKLD